MLILVVVVVTDVSEERSFSIIRVTRFVELETTLAVTSNRRMLLVTWVIEALRSSESSILTRATGHYIPEDGILLENTMFRKLGLFPFSRVFLPSSEDWNISSFRNVVFLVFSVWDE
jgi:hypothetical protein